MLKILLILTIIPYCLSNLCPKDEYWSTFSEICIKCSQCNKSNQIILKNCQSHKDTICGNIDKTKKHNDLSDKNKKFNHFELNKLHIINEKDIDQILLDNTLNYPELDLKIKHNDEKNQKKSKEIIKQRINDKFLKWNDNDDDIDDDDYYYNYDDYDYNYNKKHKKQKLIKTNHHKLNKVHHHNTFSDEDFDDNDENNLDSLLDKHSRNLSNSKKWKDNNNKHKKKLQKNNRDKSIRLAQLEDEKKLEEWLKQSRKQFKDRKDSLLKTLKEEQLDSYEYDKKLRLNYPLNDKYSKSIKYNTNINDNINIEKKQHGIDSDVELFKELIKNEESQEMELATLMSNKKDLTKSMDHYKTVTPVVVHRIYLGEPSVNLKEFNKHIKDPQEMIKEEMGRNIIYDQSKKFNILPLLKNNPDAGETGDLEMVHFTAAERLVWDWQAVAIISAIISCFLFFLVIGIFILFNARHWRKEKQHYIADNEELSTRVALIQPSLEASAAEANNTSKFLQQFLSINEETNKDKINKNIKC